MEKVAKLVTIALTTRVVVSVDATDEEIVAAATPGIMAKIHNNEMQENATIEDDTEMPYSFEQEEPAIIVATEAAKRLNELYEDSIFSVRADSLLHSATIQNNKHRYEGNDVDITFDKNGITGTITSQTINFVDIDDLVKKIYLLFINEPLEESEDFSLDYKSQSQLSYLDGLQKNSHVEIYLDDQSKAILEVWTDRENENREYVLINHEMIYLDTIRKR